MGRVREGGQAEARDDGKRASSACPLNSEASEAYLGGFPGGGREQTRDPTRHVSPQNRTKTLVFQWFLTFFAFLGALVAFGVCVLRGVVDFSRL